MAKERSAHGPRCAGRKLECFKQKLPVEHPRVQGINARSNLQHGKPGDARCGFGDQRSARHTAEKDWRKWRGMGLAQIQIKRDDSNGADIDRFPRGVDRRSESDTGRVARTLTGPGWIMRQEGELQGRLEVFFAGPLLDLLVCSCDWEGDAGKKGASEWRTLGPGERTVQRMRRVGRELSAMPLNRVR